MIQRSLASVLLAAALTGCAGPGAAGPGDGSAAVEGERIVLGVTGMT